MNAPAPATVLFDGTCRLCSGSVRFILARETSPALRFASLQSQAAARLLEEHGLDPAAMDTLVLIEGGAAYSRSDAVIRIARHLRWPWRLGAVARVVPRFLRDRGYDLVARQRFRWFGRRETCFVPSPEIASRFLDR